MNKKQLAPGIFVYSDVLDNHETLVQDIEEGAVSARVDWIQAQIKQGKESKVDTDYRDTSSISVNYNGSIINNFSNFQETFYSSLSNIFFAGFALAESDYKAEHGLETTWHDSYTILKYGQGQKFVNHIDDHKDYHRRMSLVYYINDDYTGGEIVFSRFGITYKPAKDELLIFPSTYVYNHSVLPVIEGTRYAVVSWLR
jgi:predicted 2-oxoglutarate/Fe(II)-dependent dioxygenase YbiX